MSKWVNKVPIKITTVKAREIKLSALQKIAVFGVPTSLALLYFLTFRVCVVMDNPTVDIIGKIVSIIITIIAARVFLFLYFDEKKMYETYKTDKECPIYDLSEYWDVLYIDNSGMIMTQNKEFGGQEKSFVVRLERSNLIGRSKEFEEIHYRCVTLFIRKLLSQGYNIRRYNLSVHDINEKSMSAIDKSLLSCSNRKLRDSVDSILKYNKTRLRKLHNRTIEYYKIETSGQSSRLQDDINEAIQLLTGSIYKPSICKKEEVILFFYEFFKVKYIDTKQMTINNLPKEELVVVTEVEDMTEAANIFKPIQTEMEVNVEKFKQLKKKME